MKIPGGELEYAVMIALWETGAATAREVHERVGEGLVYTTIAKVLDRLHAKGLVSRRMTGNTFRYQPKGERRAVERARARQWLVQLVRSDPAPAIAGLVDAVESLDSELLDELARAVAARRRSRHGS